VIAERYELVAPLRRGGMGALWVARHQTLGSELVIKQIDPGLVDTEAAVQRFTREAKVVAGLRSPHVVQVFDHGLHHGVPYIAMELLEGESLSERLARVGRLSPSETLRIVSHVARALGKAHEAGVAHRDLKPDNVFLVRNDDEELVKVIDFGIAKTFDASHVDADVKTQTGTLIGTPHYMSPEQARAREVDHRTDLWALGALAFECLTGARPFVGKSVSDVLVAICSDPIPVPSSQASVPDGFDAWFARAVRRDPNERFQTAREMARALSAAIGADADVSGADLESSVSNAALQTAPTLAAATPESVDRAELPTVDARSVDTTTFDGVQRRPKSDAAQGPRESPPPGRSRMLAVVGLALVIVAAFAWLARRSVEPTAVGEPASSMPAAASVAPTPPAPPTVSSPSLASVAAPVVSENAPEPAPTVAAKTGPPRPKPAPATAKPVASSAPPVASTRKDRLGF